MEKKGGSSETQKKMRVPWVTDDHAENNFPKGDYQHMTRAEICAHLALTVRALRNLEERRVIPCHKTATLDEIRASYLEHLRKMAAGRGGENGDGDLSAARAELAREQAALTALKRAELQGELVRRQDVAEEWANQIVACKRKLRGLPKKMAVTVPGFTEVMATKALEIIDGALSELAGEGGPRRERRRKVVPMKSKAKA